MIYEEIESLKKYLSDEVRVNIYIGNQDSAPSDYPCIKMIFDKPIPVFYNTGKLSISNFGLTLKIVVSKDDAIRAFEVLGLMLKCLNQFHNYKGNQYPDGDSITPTPTDNTFELDVPYILHFTVQDT